MTSLSTPLPVILCGRRVEVGKPVADLLAPQFEGIQTLLVPVQSRIAPSSYIYFKSTRLHPRPHAPTH